MLLRRNLMGLIALTVAGIPVLSLVLVYWLWRGAIARTTPVSPPGR